MKYYCHDIAEQLHLYFAALEENLFNLSGATRTESLVNFKVTLRSLTYNCSLRNIEGEVARKNALQKDVPEINNDSNTNSSSLSFGNYVLA